VVAKLKRKERGVALLAVLLGVAMMTLIVVDFAMTSGLGFVSAANQANELRATYLARSGINVGLGLLAASARAQALAQTAANQSTNPTTTDTLNDPWAAPFPPMPLEGGTVSLSIVDEERKLNINSLVANGQPSLPAIQKMQRLFTVLDVDVNLVQGIVDWITPNSGTGGMGTDFYLQLQPPYQPRFGPMPTLGDLQMVKGFNEAIFNRVSPFLSVLNTNGPFANQVNVNTAPPQVLAALEPVLMEDQKLVMTILDYRAEQPFTNATDVLNLLNIPNQSGPNAGLSNDIVVKSGYFTISGMGTYAGARKIITATFQRQQNGIGILNAWRED
jgi:general secretion pathway protein K